MPSFSALRGPAIGISAALLTGVLHAQQTLTLQQAIAMAQEQSYQAQIAKANRDGARFRDQAFYSQLMPQFSLSGSLPQYNRSIVPVVQPDGSSVFRPQDLTSTDLTATMTQKLPLLGGDVFVSSSLTRLAVSGSPSYRSWSSAPVSIGLRQPLFRPNTLAWDRRAQPIRVEKANRQYREAVEDIAIQTTNAFFDVYATRMALTNATANAGINDTLYTLNQGRFQVGKIGENDLLQSELALLRARTAVDGARLDYQRALAALRLMLRLPPEAPIEVVTPDSIPTFEADTVRAVEEALRNLSNVSDAALQDVEARRRINEAKLNNGFGATVNASYGFNATAPTMDLAYRNLLEARGFTLSVEIPVLQWGARKETIRAAEADREAITNAMRSTLEQTAQEAHFAALQLAQARRNLTISTKADTVAIRRFEIAYNRYLIGRIGIDNLYIAQTEKDQALVQYVQALRGYWAAYHRLRRTTLYDFEKNQAIE